MGHILLELDNGQLTKQTNLTFYTSNAAFLQSNVLGRKEKLNM